MAKKKRGRPRLPKGEVRDAKLPVRFSPGEVDAMRAHAERDGKSFSEWVRERLIDVATKSRED
jgi:predicted HicB family RNase H-like nuclease